MKYLPRCCIGVLLAAGITACSATATPVHSTAPTAHAIGGTLTIDDWGFCPLNSACSSAPPTSCEGTGATYGGFSDINSGTQVQIEDGSGNIVAVGSLGDGTTSTASAGFVNCTFNFEVTNVPDESIYQVAIGDRSPVTYSRAELVSNGWNVALTVS
jgi:hypothetical protein